MKTQDELLELMQSISKEKFEYFNTYYRIGFDSRHVITRFVDCVLSDYYCLEHKNRIKSYLQLVHKEDIPSTYLDETEKIYQTLEELQVLIEEFK